MTRTTWTIDPVHSLVEFAVKHLVVSTVKGRFAGVKGTIVFDEADPARSTVEAEIDVTSVDTREAQRDAHLRSADFFDAEHYPTLTFKSTRVEPIGRDRFRVVGDLTMRGVTREVVLDTTFNGAGRHPAGFDVAGFTAETTLDRDEFGIRFNTALDAGGWAISKTVKVQLEIEAKQKAGDSATD